MPMKARQTSGTSSPSNTTSRWQRRWPMSRQLSPPIRLANAAVPVQRLEPPPPNSSAERTRRPMSSPRWAVDGGGFRLVDARSDVKFAYVYVQFESRRKGYIDDMEVRSRPSAHAAHTCGSIAACQDRIAPPDITSPPASRVSHLAVCVGRRRGQRAHLLAAGLLGLRRERQATQLVLGEAGRHAGVDDGASAPEGTRGILCAQLRHGQRCALIEQASRSRR
jgi:hypothetical protein